MQANEALVPVSTEAPQLPAMREVRVGKSVRQVQYFTQSCNALEIKRSLKSANPKLSAKALSLQVNQVIRGEKSLREQLGVAWVQATIQAGFVPDKGEICKNSASLRFYRVKEDKPAPAPEKPKTVAEILAGLSPEERAEMVRSLLAESK